MKTWASDMAARSDSIVTRVFDPSGSNRYERAGMPLERRLILQAVDLADRHMWWKQQGAAEVRRMLMEAWEIGGDRHVQVDSVASP